MADESNTKTMVTVAIIGAIGAIGAALIPIILADRSPPPAIVIAAPPAVTPTPDPVAIPNSASAGKAEPDPAPATKKAAMTKKAAAPADDEERIQGRWRIVTAEARAKGTISEERDDNPVWRFHGDQLEVLRMVDGKMTPTFAGTFKIHRGPRGRGFFDASETAQQGKQQGMQWEWVGIYAFEGDLLKICYKIRRVPDEPVPERPTVFALDGDTRNFTFNIRFKRLGPPRP